MPNTETCAITLWRTEHSLLTIEDLARAVAIAPEVVDTFVRYRLVKAANRNSSNSLFPISSIDRLRRILRLRYDYGVNLAGVSVILEMAERIEELTDELNALRGDYISQR
jgi:DNA-binding transcriptional MerR regulator